MSEERLRIVAAAVKTDNGMVFTLPRPARHHHILHKMVEMGLDAISLGHPEAQGFLASDGRFLARPQSFWCALDAGQIEERKTNLHGELFSEDVW